MPTEHSFIDIYSTLLRVSFSPPFAT